MSSVDLLSTMLQGQGAVLALVVGLVGMVLIMLMGIPRTPKGLRPLSSLPTPSEGSFLLGQASQMVGNRTHLQLTAWANHLGRRYRVRLFNQPILVLSDPKDILPILGYGDSALPKAVRWEAWGGGSKVVKKEYWCRVRVRVSTQVDSTGRLEELKAMWAGRMGWGGASHTGVDLHACTRQPVPTRDFDPLQAAIWHPMRDMGSEVGNQDSLVTFLDHKSEGHRRARKSIAAAFSMDQQRKITMPVSR